MKPIQIKCYCGHTTYCDCSPIEEPKENNHIGETNEMVESQAKTLQIQSKSKAIAELSDEEIEEYAKRNAFNYYEFTTGAKWYREQLKK